MGYRGAAGSAEQLGRSGDEGLDGVIKQDPLGLDRIYVQAKRYAADNTVGLPDIQGFVGALHGAQADRGVFITTSHFTPDAHDYAWKVAARVILIDGVTLAGLLVEHNEKVRRLLPGFVTLGDAACSFNPIYGQGMSCAALQADALGKTVRAVGVRSHELPRGFHRRAAKIIDAPWAIAVGADFLHPKTAGPKARGTDQLNRYVLRLIRATHTSVRVAKTFNLVLNLNEPTSSLMRPTVVARVLASSIPGRRRHVEIKHPQVGPAGTV
jgi:hypothetical protein